MNEFQYGVAWTEEYALDCEEVDSQHRRLFELVSDVVKACTEGYEVNVLNKTLGFLVDYTVQHFADEEAFQVLHGYPDYKRHKQLHEDFKVTVGDLIEEFQNDGSTRELSSKVNKVVIRWLVNHILREDKKIGEHIRSMEEIDQS